MAIALTSQGSGGSANPTYNPYTGSTAQNPTMGTPSTPAANALNLAQNSQPAPSTPVKNVTVTNPDGGSVSTDYHPSASGSSGTSSGVLQQNNPTANPYTGSTANSPTVGQGTQDIQNPYAGYSNSPTSQFQSSNPSNSPATFPGIVSGLANTSANGSQNSTQATQGLLNSPYQNQQLSNEAAAIGSNYGQQIAQTSNYGQGLAAGELTSGAITPIAQGTAGISQNITANKVQGLQSAENAALAPINQQLTAQEQAQSGLAAAGSNANTQQANTQSGLTSAGTLANPSATAYGQTAFNPLTQSFGANGSNTVSPNDPLYPALQQYAQMAANGQYNAIPASITGNPALSAQLNSMASGINPNYSPVTSAGQGTGAEALAAAPGQGAATGAAATAAAPGQATATNIGTAGTAETGAYSGIYNTATTAQANITQQQSAINSIGSQALQLMANTPGINPNSSQFANTKINQLASQFSSPQYAAFNTAIQSLQARVGAALQAGEIPTAATANAESIANGSLTMGALASTLKQVDAELTSFASTQGALADYAKSQMQQGTTSSGSTTNTSASPSSSGGWGSLTY